MRDFSVSILSTGSPLEKLLCKLSASRCDCGMSEPGVYSQPYLPRKVYHSLCQSNLSQLFIFLFTQRVAACSIASGLFLRGEASFVLGTRVVEDGLVLERLIRQAESGIVDGQEGKTGWHDGVLP